MGAQKNKDSLNQNIEFYKDYFKEELDAIEEELKKSKEYSAIIDAEIKKLSGPSLGANKGAQHYLIEHITNAVSLQTQRQGLRRDNFAIKKAIIDYAAKFAEENATGDENAIINKINELIEMDKGNKKKDIASSQQDQEDLDAAIDAALNDEN